MLGGFLDGGSASGPRAVQIDLLPKRGGAVADAPVPVALPAAFAKASGDASVSVDAQGRISLAAGLAQGASAGIVVRVTGADGVIVDIPVTLRGLRLAGPRFARADLGDVAGMEIAAITGIPAGAVPVLTPSDGRFVIAGNEVAGWKLAVGAQPLAAGIVEGWISAPGCLPARLKVIVRDVAQNAMQTEGGGPMTDEAGAALSGDVVSDSGQTKLRELARAKGILFGSAVQSDARLSKPGPGGVGTLADFLRDQCDIYVPGVYMLPDYIQPSPGVFTLANATAFVARALADGKAFRGHCLLYPERDTPAIIAALNAGNWRAMIDAHFEAVASIPGIQRIANWDVVNEVMISSNTALNGGYKTNHWWNASGGAAYLVYAFQKARKCFPDAGLFWCDNSIEQLSGSYQFNHASNILAALEAALHAGAPIDGFNMQAHLTYRLSFHRQRLKDFCTSITQTLGLKLIIGELDARTGFSAGQLEDTIPATGFASTAHYEDAQAMLVRQFLETALPFVAASGGQLLCWGLTDADHAWEAVAGERPLPFGSAYQPKPFHHALRAAFKDL